MPVQCWRFPALTQVVSMLVAVVNIILIKVLFVTAFAIPLMALTAVLAVLVCGRPSAVILNPAAGVVMIRRGFFTQRIRLIRITSAEVKRTGLTICYVGGRQVSLCTNWLVSWLHIRTPADDIIRAISRTVEDMRDAGLHDPQDLAAIGSPSNRPMILLACTGCVAIVAAFLVRFSWPNPVLTAVAVLFAIYVGLTGVFLVMFAVWILSAGRQAADPPAKPASPQP